MPSAGEYQDSMGSDTGAGSRENEVRGGPVSEWMLGRESVMLVDLYAIFDALFFR